MRRGVIGPALVLTATVVQLVVATTSDLPQFAGKAFGARLVFYPLMMLLVPALWVLVTRVRGRGGPVPWAGFTLVMVPFLLDVSGNSLDLYDRVVWWDDLLHFLNWFLLLSGLGLVVGARELRPRWARALAVVGTGALLALLWEIGEWWTFIRHGTEIETAYEDTLGDMVLGTSGSVLALLVLSRRWIPARSGSAPR